MKPSLFRWIADFRGSFVKGRPYASLRILIQRVTDAPDLYASGALVPAAATGP
jgi:hypothetical protein